MGLGEPSVGAGDEAGEPGLVDYVVVEFPDGVDNFTGEVAAELASLVENGIIRIIDVRILSKSTEGTVRTFAVDDLAPVPELAPVVAQLGTPLAPEQVQRVAATIEAGCTAGLVVWENVWADPFGAAARRTGNHLVPSGRLPVRDATLRSDHSGMTTPPAQEPDIGR